MEFEVGDVITFTGPKWRNTGQKHIVLCSDRRGLVVTPAVHNHTDLGVWIFLNIDMVSSIKGVVKCSY